MVRCPRVWSYPAALVHMGVSLTRMMVATDLRPGASRGPWVGVQDPGGQGGSPEGPPGPQSSMEVSAETAQPCLLPSALPPPPFTSSPFSFPLSPLLPLLTHPFLPEHGGLWFKEQRSLQVGGREQWELPAVLGRNKVVYRQCTFSSSRWTSLLRCGLRCPNRVRAHVG